MIRWCWWHQLTLSAKSVADLKLAVSSELNNLTCWLRASRLSLTVAKTELIITGSRQRLNDQCEGIDISIDDKTIKRVDHTKSLGLTIDAQLYWSKRVDEICKKASSAISELKRVRTFIPTNVAVQIYNALILYHILITASRFGIVWVAIWEINYKNHKIALPK